MLGALLLHCTDKEVHVWGTNLVKHLILLLPKV